MKNHQLSWWIFITIIQRKNKKRKKCRRFMERNKIRKKKIVKNRKIR